MKQKQIKTPEQVKSEFAERGESIAEWAKNNNVAAHAVYRVLSQPRLTAVRGECHRAAVLLGLKCGVVPGAKAA